MLTRCDIVLSMFSFFWWFMFIRVRDIFCFLHCFFFFIYFCWMNINIDSHCCCSYFPWSWIVVCDINDIHSIDCWCSQNCWIELRECFHFLMHIEKDEKVIYYSIRYWWIRVYLSSHRYRINIIAIVLLFFLPSDVSFCIEERRDVPKTD